MALYEKALIRQDAFMPVAPGTKSKMPRTSPAEKLLVLAVVCLITVVMTWPLITHLNDAIKDYGDPLLNAWILWWDVHALFAPGASLFNAPIFHPFELTLAYSEHMIVSALTVSPLLLAGASPVLAHNLLLMLSFVLAGFGAYLLGFELTGKRVAAWVACLGYAFSVFRFGHLGHLQILTAHFMPFVLLYLHRWARGGAWLDAVLWALFWVLQILSCGYHGLFISFAVGVFLVQKIIADKWWKHPARWIQMGSVFALAALFVLPFFLPYVEVKNKFGFKRSLELSGRYSLSPENLLATQPGNLIYGKSTKRFRDLEGRVFPGITLIALMLLGLGMASSGKRSGDEGDLRLLFLQGAVWASWLAGLGLIQIPLSHSYDGLGVGLLILGAVLLMVWRVIYLRLSGESGRVGVLRFSGLKTIDGAWWGVSQNQFFYVLLFGLSIWAALGPKAGLYTLLYNLAPGFDAIRVPTRMVVLTTLALAVLAAYGAAALSKRFGNRRGWKTVGAPLLCLLILLGAFSAPIKWDKIYTTPPLVYKWLAKQEPGSVVMEIPTFGFEGFKAHDARYVYWQTLHKMPLINGYSGFFPPGYKKLAELAHSRYLDEAFLLKIRSMGARFLVVHKREYRYGIAMDLVRDLNRIPYLKLVYQDKWDMVYEFVGN